MRTLRDWLAERTAGTGEQRLALIVQGGGMRGVYSMGALAALEEAGLTSSFDVVSGASAGAINGAYFLAGQANDAVSVYVDALSNKRFINPFRLWRIVDIDFMVDSALRSYCPIDVEKVRTSKSLLQIVLTDAKSGLRVIKTNRDDVDLFELFRATSALPILYGKRVSIDGVKYVDGGVSDSLPIELAENEGAQTILAVLTRPPGHRGVGLRTPLRQLARLSSLGQSAAMRAKVGLPNSAYNDAMDKLEGVVTHGTRTFVVRPSRLDSLVSLATSSRAELQACAELGRQDMFEQLGAKLS